MRGLGRDVVRPSCDADVPAITEIYSFYVRTSLATFEIDPPGAEEITRRRVRVLSRGLPYLVADVNGEIAASIGLHQAFGFRHVGVLEAVGFKFGRWVDTVLMQRPLGTGGGLPPD
jgi:L-amino acid N-acyltransferase YncA